MMETITVCTRCNSRWEGDYEYCPKCEPVLATAERERLREAFTDQANVHGSGQRGEPDAQTRLICDS
jgi:hypothetical protein